MSSRFLVICHVMPLSADNPGCEISRPCFRTSFIYLSQMNFKFSKQFDQTASLITLEYIRCFYSRLWIKVLNSQVLIPDKYIIVRCHNIRVQKTLSIPPCNVDNIRIIFTIKNLHIRIVRGNRKNAIITI